MNVQEALEEAYRRGYSDRQKEQDFDLGHAGELVDEIRGKHFNPPEEAVVLVGEMSIISYLKEDGESGYGIGTHGDVPMTTWLGMTVIAQNHIAGWRYGETRD